MVYNASHWFARSFLNVQAIQNWPPGLPPSPSRTRWPAFLRLFAKTVLIQGIVSIGFPSRLLACEQWPRGVRVGPVTVLAGAGHNGGGGICAAYHLLCQSANVCVFQKLGIDVQPPFAGTAKIRLNICGDSPVFPGSPLG